MTSLHNYKFINILNHQKFIPICLSIFILLRFVPMIFLPVTPSSDSDWYLSRAIDLMNGLGYQEGGYPTAYWPVGYPGFLAAIFAFAGTSVLAAQLANLLASIGSFFLILALSRKLFKVEHVGRISILIITFYPNNIFYNSLLLTETLYTFILLGCFYLFLLSNKKAFVTLTGISFGLATLIKTQTLLIPFIPIFITIIVFWIKDKKSA